MDSKYALCVGKDVSKEATEMKMSGFLYSVEVQKAIRDHGFEIEYFETEKRCTGSSRDIETGR